LPTLWPVLSTAFRGELFGSAKQRAVLDDDECLKVLLSIIVEAVEIGREFGQLNADLDFTDQAWFSGRANAEGYISVPEVGERIEARGLAKDLNLNTAIKAKVGIMLFPGLVKYGRDDSQDFGSWSV
jgi:hypothetical protein